MSKQEFTVDLPKYNRKSAWGWIISHLLRFALWDDIWTYVSREEVREVFPYLELPENLAVTPFEEWPLEIRELLEQYAPGGLSVALVTGVHDDNTASLIMRDGVAATLPWRGIRWAKPFIDRETTGPEPESVTDVRRAGRTPTRRVVIRVVPAAVPSVTQSSAPLTPSSARK